MDQIDNQVLAITDSEHNDFASDSQSLKQA
jgi:hypothetical protein